MKTARAITGIIAAAAVGAAVGMAFAPDKGSNTRKKVKKQVEDLSENAKRMAVNAKDKTISKANDVYEEGRRGVNKLVDKVSKTASEVEAA